MVTELAVAAPDALQTLTFTEILPVVYGPVGATIVFVNWMDTAPMMETAALTDLPFSSAAPFVTQDPAAQVATAEVNVNVAGGSQASMLPTAHVTVLPDLLVVPLLGLPTTDTLLMQPGTASVTVTFSGGIVAIVRLRKAVLPSLD